MATSPNYAWAEPDNSSLVKNGAADIRTLGDAIDTSVWNVGFGQAGKNKIINGDFAINQRAFTSVTTNAAFCFDRFKLTKVGSDGTTTITPQTFTPGAAPVAGYESVNFLRIATTGQTDVNTASIVNQPIEDVRTFAGQTVTISFWAKAATGTPKVAVEAEQIFGSGGSSSVLNYAGQVTISTSWARYSATVAIPSVSGKTITTGTRLNINLWTSAGSTYNARTGSMGIQTATIDFWGVQAEYGSKATPFQTASGGSPQAELAMCQRYYLKSYNQETAPATASNSVGNFQFQALSATPTASRANVRFPVTMRISPTITVYSTNSGTSAKLYNEAAAVDLDALTQYIGQTGFTVYANSGTPTLGNPLLVHYVASAEL